MLKKIFLFLIGTVFAFTLIGCGSSDGSPSSQGDDGSSQDIDMVEYGVAGHITEIETGNFNSILGKIRVEGSKNNGATYSRALVKQINVVPDETDED